MATWNPITQVTNFAKGAYKAGEGVIEGDWSKAKEGLDMTDQFTPQKYKDKVNRGFNLTDNPDLAAAEAAKAKAKADLDAFIAGGGAAGGSGPAPGPTAPRIDQVSVAQAAATKAETDAAAAKAKLDAAVAARDAAVAAAAGMPYDPNNPLTVAASNASAAVGSAQANYQASVSTLSAARSSLTQATATDPTGGRTLNAGPAQAYTAPTTGPAATYQAPQATAIGYTPAQSAYGPLVQGGTATAQQVTAQQIAAPGDITAQQIGMPGGVSAGHVTAERIGMDQVGSAGAGQIAATLAGRQTIAPAGSVTADQIDRQLLERQNADASRAEFMDALAKIKIAAEGGAPSAAEALMRKGIDEAVGAQHGLAASLQGRNPGVALRTASIGAKDAIAKSAADMAALRAGEQATARGQFGEFAKGLNANDIQTAGLQLGADVDINKANQSAKLGADTATLGAKTQTNVAQLGADVAITQTNVDNLLKAAQSNQTTELQSSIANLNARLDVLKSNQAAALQAGMANQAADLQAQIVTLQESVKVATANASNALTARIETTRQQLDVLKSNQAAALRAGEVNAANDLQAQIATMTNNLNAAISNQSMVTQVNLANTGYQNEASKFGAAETNLTSRFNTGLAADAAQFGAAQTNDFTKYNTGLTADALKFGAEQTNLTDRFNAGQNLSATQTNIDAGLRQQVINNARDQGLRDDQIEVLLASLGMARQDSNQQKALDAAGDARLMQLISMGASGISNPSPGGGATKGANGSYILE